MGTSARSVLLRSVPEAELRGAEAWTAASGSTLGSGCGSGSRSISAVMLPAAISRNASTVGLSFSSGNVGFGSVGEPTRAL